MYAPMLLAPDSTAKQILRQLDAAAPLTQRQLLALTGRTKGAISKALKLLLAEGYVRFSAGEKASRLGRLDARHVQEYSRTAKKLPEEAERDTTALTAGELCAVMDAVVRSALAAQRTQSVSA